MIVPQRHAMTVVRSVLYVLRYYPTLTETFVYREIRALQERGVRVVVAAIDERADGALQDGLPEVDVLRPPRGWEALSLLRFAGVAMGQHWGLRQLRSRDVARAVWLAERVKELGIDRIHAHFAGEAAEWARIAAGISGVPYSVTVHGTDLFRPRPGIADVLRDARPVVTVAEHHVHRLRAVYGVEASLVRCGVPRFSMPPAQPQGDGPLRLICVARHVPKKGLEDLIEAIRDLDDVELRLVSDAPESWGNERIQVGPLPPSRIFAALAESHVFVLPCRIAPDGDRDGLPVAILEAMAVGLPVLTCPIAGIPEVVDDEVGWLVEPGDVDALRAKIRKIASDPAERARKGAAARWRIGVLGLTAEAQGDGLLAAWADAAARG